MCGRFTLRTPMAVLVEQFQLDAAPQQLALQFNIAPTQDVVTVRVTGTERIGVLCRWGLVPWWSTDTSKGSRLINARGETVATRNSFREPFKSRRCLVLADGYLEWKKVGSKKQPFHIHRRDDRPFAMAGLWDRWTKGDEPVESCTIITTDANKLTQEVHDRMPVILPESQYDLWLDPEFQDPAPLQEMLRPFPSEELVMDAVSTRVNNIRNDDPACLEIQRELF